LGNVWSPAGHSDSGSVLIGGAKVKSEILIETILVGALAIYGVRLAKEIRTLRLQPDRQQFLATANERLALHSVTGIDTSGQLVNKIIVPGTKRFMVFGLRNSNLAEDLSFWSNAAALVHKDGGISFVGFCDSKACVEAVRSNYQSLRFPVIAYGEAVSSQALLNADAEGNFILLDGGLRTISTMQWRQPGLTPEYIVRAAQP
jgi:hypothetical protein